MAVFALACVPLVFQAPTAVDRVALYFIPLQLAVAGYLPTVVVAQEHQYVRLTVIAFYGLVLFVWLNFANHANAWVPYQFWPLA